VKSSDRTTSGELGLAEGGSNVPTRHRKSHRGKGMDANQDSGLRILLVEDNEAILTSLGDLLKFMGHSVIEARGVPEALSHYQCQPIDLLISDINLGNGSGLDLIRHIRQTCEIPAIAMSAQSDLSVASLAAGFSVFLDKPFSKSSLEATIRLVVSNHPIPELGSPRCHNGFRSR
jgi:CheY-like chemotaxis protein